MSCDTCHHWTVRRETIYGNGETIVNWEAPSGKGHCESLGIETDSVFGCNRFIEGGGDHVEQKRKSGQPWQHFVMIDCPDCGGKGDGGRGHRCAGTGKVRLYDDGYIGDEQTRTHPKEIPVPSNCFKCSAPVNKEWAHCPACGTALWIEGEFEVVSDMDAGLPPPEPPQQIEGPQ